MRQPAPAPWNCAPTKSRRPQRQLSAVRAQHQARIGSVSIFSMSNQAWRILIHISSIASARPRNVRCPGMLVIVTPVRALSKILLSLLAVLVILVYVLLNPPLDVPAGELSQGIYKRGPH